MGIHTRPLADWSCGYRVLDMAIRYTSPLIQIIGGMKRAHNSAYPDDRTEEYRFRKLHGSQLPCR